MKTYHELIKESESFTAQYDVSISAIKLLMYELTQEKAIDLYLDYHKEADKDIAIRFNAGIERLIKQEPLAYILGYQWFYGRKLLVNEDVFIPRYETEELCANVLERIDAYFNDYQDITLADVACGSGAIAITLSAEEKKLKTYAVELNDRTLTMAKANAINNDVDITFFNGDMLQPLITNSIKLDILVSNPPYISTNESLDRSVVDYEPNMALFGGEDGLKFYRIILTDAKKVLNDKAMMAFEIGYQQKEDLISLVSSLYPGQKVEVIKDLNGKDRMLFVYINL